MENARPSTRRPAPIRLLLAAVLALTLFAAAGCKSTGTAESGAPAAAQPAAAGTSGPASDTTICGTPPCMRYVSRGDTKTLADTVGAHPFLSGIVLHTVVGLLCGGLLCVLGEGVGVTYVGEVAKQAAAAHECLRVRILPDGKEWHLVDVTASNQSPYCTD